MRPTLLIVDDTEFLRFVLGEIAREAGIAVVAEAGSAAEALDLQAALEPGLAVVDLTADAVVGEALLGALLARDPALALAAVVAPGDAEGAARARARGVREVLEKPYDPDAARAALQRLSCVPANA
ncbi:MAG: response regulator [bacterium]|nr:response regulator [bacterium]MBK7702925.1 response regulator [bacterium]